MPYGVKEGSREQYCWYVTQVSGFIQYVNRFAIYYMTFRVLEFNVFV